MDIVYIVNKNKSYCDNYELRWSLRSLEKYAKGIDKVFIVGELPDFLNEETLILVPLKQNKVSTIFEKRIEIDKCIKYVLDNYDVSEDFLVSFDDHYLLKEVDYNNYPYFVRKTSKLGIFLPSEERDKAEYNNFLVKTRNLLIDNGLPVYNFILHKNIKLNKSIYNECWEKFSEIQNIGIETFALCLNYQYAKNPFNFEEIKDYKLHDVTTNDILSLDIDSFSSYDMVNYCIMFSAMQELYPDKSKYEND